MKRYSKKNTVSLPKTTHHQNAKGAYVLNGPPPLSPGNRKREAQTQAHNSQNHDLLETSNSLPAEFFNADPNQPTVSSVDGKIITDDISNINVKSHEPQMFKPLNTQQVQASHPSHIQQAPMQQIQNSVNVPDSQEDDVVSELYDLVGESYLLLVNGNMVCSGPKEMVQEEVEDLIYGFHELCDGVNIENENICIVKKVPIKVGAFIE